MTTFHQVKQFAKPAKADVFFLQCCVRIWWVSKTTVEGQKLEWEPARPTAITMPQMQCNLHSPPNAMCRRGRDAIKITLIAVTDASAQSYDLLFSRQVMVGIWDIKYCRKQRWDKGGRLLPGFCQAVLAGLAGICEGETVSHMKKTGVRETSVG